MNEEMNTQQGQQNHPAETPSAPSPGERPSLLQQLAGTDPTTQLIPPAPQPVVAPEILALPPQDPITELIPPATELPLDGAPPPPPGEPPLPPEKSGGSKKWLLLLLAALAVAGLIFAGVNLLGKGKMDRDNVIITAAVEEPFVQTKQVVLEGLSNYTKEQIEDNLVFTPDIGFSVTMSGDIAVVTLNVPRNISYAGTFRYQTTKGEPRQEAFTVNGPLLSVALDNDQIDIDREIVLRFSEPADLQSLKKQLSIEPKTEVTLSHPYDDLSVVSLAPAKEWDRTSPYLLTIGKDYASQSGKEFADDQRITVHLGSYNYETQSFTEYGTGPEVFFHNDDNFIITEDVNMVLTFTGERLTSDLPIAVETYLVGDVEKFKSQSDIYLNYDIGLSSLTKVDSNAYLLKDGENRLEIPNPGQGAYVISATYNDPIQGEETQVRTGYLITPYSVYVQASSTETLAWIHSGESDQPLGDYTIDLGGDRTGKTDETGIVIIPHLEPDPKMAETRRYDYYGNSNYNPTQLSILDPKGNLVYYDNANLRNEKQQEDRLYYSTFFIDRQIYQPEDTISFWGFVRPFRTNGDPLPAFATVVFDKGGLELTVEAPIDKNGVYHGEFQLEQIRSANYSIEAFLVYPPDPDQQPLPDEQPDNEVSVGNQYISVRQYQKPAYVIQSQADKTFYQPGEQVKITVTPTFYDGSPLPNFPLEIYTADRNGDWVQKPNLTTDAGGSASFTFLATDSREEYNNYGNLLESGYYRVQIASDGEDITQVSQYKYLVTDLLIDSTIAKQADGKNLSLNLGVYKLDFDSAAFKAAVQQAEAKEYLYPVFETKALLATAKGDPVDLSANLGIRWKYTDSGQKIHNNLQSRSEDAYLDFKNSYSLDITQIPADLRESWEREEKQIRITTKEGKALIPDLIQLPDGASIDFTGELRLRVSLNYNDPKGKNISSWAYYPDNSDYDWNPYGSEETTPQGLTFQVTDKGTGEDLTPEANYYRSISMDAGGSANFKLLLDGLPVDRNGTILYTIMQGGLVEHHLIQANEFDLDYLLDYGFGVQLVAAYFDGTRVHYISDLELSATRESLAANLEITPDKESYTPGETVNLTIKATDYQGNGIPGNLCVAVVDEAIFALEDQYLYTLSNIFSVTDYLDNYITKYCTTYRGGGANSQVWSGGKGESGYALYNSYRSNFKDTALFLPTRTDPSGNATVTFTLPDNTTSWRITTVEVGDNLRSGEGTHNIISTLPFFVKPVLTSKYIEGDEVSVLAQGHGILLKEGSEITYTLTLTGDGVNETLTAKGVAYQPWEFNFGVLPMGSYTLESKAEFDGYSDTVVLPLHVIKSNLELVINKPVPLAVGQKLDIAAMRYPVSLTLYDSANKEFFGTVNSLLGHYCMMPSQRIARLVAKETIRDTVAEGELPYYVSKDSESIADMQNSDGGIRGTEDGNSDPMLSYYLTLVAKDQFNQPLLTQYLTEQLGGQQDSKTTAALYLALASLGETTPAQIETQLEKTSSTDEVAYYIAALSYLGEQDKATKLYNEQLHPKLSDIASRPYPTSSYGSFNKAERELERDTAAIWVAASRLNPTDADGISAYFNGSPWRYRTLFEAMIYLKNYTRPVTQHSFSYQVNGETKTGKLSTSGAATLVLSKSQLESLSFTDLPTGLTANAYYVGEPAEIGITPSDSMSITKTVTNQGENTYQVKLDLTLAADSPNGEYDISDWVPSNARLYSQPDYSNRTPMSEGQKLYFTYYRDRQVEETITFTYQIRQTFRAEAVLDTVYVIHGESGENCTAEKTIFKPANSRFPLPMTHIEPAKSVLDPTSPSSQKEPLPEKASSTTTTPKPKDDPVFPIDDLPDKPTSK